MPILRQLLAEIESAEGPLSFRELEQRLTVDREALRGMVEFLVRKGRLRASGPGGASITSACYGCSHSCGDGSGCPFVVEAPPTIALSRRDDS